jgi:hypothetical protein
MTKYVAAVVAAIVCALTLAQGASAQTSPARLTQVVPLTGAAKNGSTFNGKYTIERFIAKGDKLYSVGTLKGKLRGKRVVRHDVRLPASVGDASARASQVPLPPLPPGNACAILSLDLGPINLNLLGLVVRTNQIQLRIDAVQGAGNLLGNLLCGITGILNPSALTSTPLSQLAQVLNALLALSPRTG